ncbi:MAG: PTS sugar transporter subunit IIB [Deltaproteobacteria bacterium]|nr:PTS sugar transporter subunit IIB [Deltaproteobacteria bacterium]
MMKKILVACGTAIATSTVVAKKLQEALEKRGLAVKIDQCKASEVAAKVKGYDLVVSTTEVGDTGGKPLVRTVSFLTGIGVDADVQKIAKLLGG